MFSQKNECIMRAAGKSAGQFPYLLLNELSGGSGKLIHPLNADEIVPVDRPCIGGAGVLAHKDSGDPYAALPRGLCFLCENGLYRQTERLPRLGKPPFILLSFWNISESKLDALLDLDFAALNICAILREYRRLHAPRDAASCRQLPRHRSQPAGDAAVPAERLHLHRRIRGMEREHPVRFSRPLHA